jgi:hypothetical protein
LISGFLFAFHSLDKKVCEKGKNQREGTRPFYALTPGQQFTTKFGTVEVIRDERHVPTAPPITDLPAKMKRYASSKSKRDVQLKKRIVNARVDSIVRRRILSWYYQKHGGIIVYVSVVDAYNIGVEGKQRSEFTRPSVPTVFLPDPTTPDNSYPDRLVECKWIPDQRPRQNGVASEPIEGQSTAALSGTLFLQRRLLVTPYSADTTRMYCSYCWQCFLSKPGYRHHFDSKSCQLRAQKLAAEKDGIEQSVVIRARRKLEQRFHGRYEVLKEILADSSDDDQSEENGSNDDNDNGDDEKSPVKAKRAKIAKGKAGRPQKIKPEEPLISPNVLLLELQSELLLLQGRLLGPVYPQVWASLGFKKPRKKRVRKKKMTATSNKRMKREPLPLPIIDATFLVVEPNNSVGPLFDIKTAAAISENIPAHSLDAVSATISMSKGAAIATSTPELEKKPAAKNVAESLEDTNESEGQSSRVVVPFSLFRASGGIISSQAYVPVTKPEAPDQVGEVKSSDLPPMIDIQVFIEEVDSGRYPSMKRHQKKHDDVCALCRKKVVPHFPSTSKAAKLLPCIYCQKSVHFHCAGTRYRLKYPEPNEEFMCHHCISKVCQMRRRAEKRRLEKMDIDLPNEDEELAMRLKKVKLATELVPGEEFECVSEQGKRCEDLGVLLADTRSRLDLYLKIAKGNDGRRTLIRQMEKVQLG